jgi:hypothetical protein
MMFPEENIDLLKQLARKRSYKDQTDVVYTDLIREAVDRLLLEEGGENEGK